MNTSELEFSPPAISESDSRPDAARAFRRRLFWLLSVLVLGAGAGTWLLAQGRQGSPLPGPQPAFGTLLASPPNLVFNTPTPVTFTIRIETPTLNPTTVELQRLDDAGNFVKSLGRMYDNGQGGDAKPGDRIFTAMSVLNEPKIGRHYYRVAAAFRGNQQNAFSSTLSFEVWKLFALDTVPLTFAYPASLDVITREGSGGSEIVLVDPQPISPDLAVVAIVETFSVAADNPAMIEVVHERLPPVAILSVRPLLNGLLVEADDFVRFHYFQYNPSSRSGIEVYGAPENFFMSTDFAGLVSSLRW